MLLLNLHKHKSYAFDGDAAASSCFTACICSMILVRVQQFVVTLPLHAASVDSIPNARGVCCAKYEKLSP